MSCVRTSMFSSFAENGTVDFLFIFLVLAGFNALIEHPASEIFNLHSHFISHFFFEDCNGCV